MWTYPPESNCLGSRCPFLSVLCQSPLINALVKLCGMRKYLKYMSLKRKKSGGWMILLFSSMLPEAPTQPQQWLAVLVWFFFSDWLHDNVSWVPRNWNPDKHVPYAALRRSKSHLDLNSSHHFCSITTVLGFSYMHNCGIHKIGDVGRYLGSTSMDGFFDLTMPLF